jgi:hypothetical protein
MIPESELSLRCRGRYERCTQQTQETSIHVVNGIWMCIPSSQGPTDQRVRPHGHQDRPVVGSVASISFVHYGPNPNCALQQTLFTSFYNDIIYLLTAIGLPPGGRSTVHIYTQTIHQNDTKTIYRTTQKFWKSAGRAPCLRVIPWHLPYNWGKSTEKPQSG